MRRGICVSCSWASAPSARRARRSCGPMRPAGSAFATDDHRGEAAPRHRRGRIWRRGPWISRPTKRDWPRWSPGEIDAYFGDRALLVGASARDAIVQTHRSASDFYARALWNRHEARRCRFAASRRPRLVEILFNAGFARCLMKYFPESKRRLFRRKSWRIRLPSKGSIGKRPMTANADASGSSRRRCWSPAT